MHTKTNKSKSTMRGAAPYKMMAFTAIICTLIGCLFLTQIGNKILSGWFGHESAIITSDPVADRHPAEKRSRSADFKSVKEEYSMQVKTVKGKPYIMLEAKSGGVLVGNIGYVSQGGKVLNIPEKNGPDIIAFQAPDGFGTWEKLPPQDMWACPKLE